MLPASDAIGLFLISSQADRYRRSFSPFAAANDTFRDALMVMASPVAGLASPQGLCARQRFGRHNANIG